MSLQTPAAIALVRRPPPFEPMYRAEVSYVWNSLRRLGAEERDLPDLTQNVFLAVHRQLATYDSRRPLRLWLFGIAFRVMSNHRRGAQQKREVLETPLEPADETPSVEEQIDARRKRQLVLEALVEIDPDRRVVLVMHDLDGHTMPEIAAELGIGLNTLYSRLRFARADFLVAAARIRRSRGEP